MKQKHKQNSINGASAYFFNRTPMGIYQMKPISHHNFPFAEIYTTLQKQKAVVVAGL